VVGSVKTRCVVVLSGGPDSATVAYWAKNRGYKVHAITFNYGQLAAREIECAGVIAEGLGISHKVIDLSPLREIYVGVTSLVDEDMPMPSTFTDPLIVPFRNGVFLAVAVAYASTIGATKILYGAHGSDEPFYPDCRKEFYKAFENAARLGTEHEITIESPFSDNPKSEIIRMGSDLGVPFHLTWSCYLNGPLHCGRCESCMNRKRAFKEAAIPDPTEYMG
jgi:7-cyano-7-deazaguanine synthase